MQFTIPATVFMAFVSGALAQVAGFDTMAKPAKGEVLAAGETYTITWDAAPAEYDDELISIILLAGETPQTLVPGAEPIAAGVVNSVGQYEWAIPATLGDDETYGFKIQLESDEEVFQYSFPFKIEGSGDVPSNSTQPTAEPTSDCTTTTPTHSATASSNATVTPPPKTTLTSTSVAEPTAEPTEEPEEPEPSQPVSGAVANGAMGTVALVGALAAAVFAF